MFGAVPGRRGRKRGYDDIALPLKTIWLVSDQMCGKRLAEALPLWLPFYETHHGRLSAEKKAKLQKISPAQIDQLLSGARLQAHSKTRTPKPESLLARDIPLSADSPCPADQPGWIETDTVAHCGGDMSRSFAGQSPTPARASDGLRTAPYGCAARRGRRADA